MPTLTDPELKILCEQFSEFSDKALEQAIATARDPDKAEQLLDRLRCGIAQKRNTFENLALCVVMGEARVTKAIPLLLDIATYDDLDTLQDAAQYALQRMGTEAFDAAMACIESAAEPHRRVLAYEILMAVVDGDEVTKSRVADFLLRRAEIDCDVSSADEDWCPFVALANVLEMLRDERFVPVIRRLLAMPQPAKTAQLLRGILEWLTHHEQQEWETEWRRDYRERCAEWMEYYWDEDEDAPADEDDWNEHHARVAETAAKLGMEFGRSRFAEGLEGYSPAEAGNEIAHWLGCAWEYTGQNPEALRLTLTQEMLYEWMPRKFSCDPEYFEQFPRILGAFFLYLEDQGALPEAKRFHRLARVAETRLPKLAANPENWGMAKSFTNAGQEAGFDMTTQEGMNAFMLYFNTRQLARNTRLSPDQLPWGLSEEEVEMEEEIEPLRFPPTRETIHRTAPRVGRNDPCPCGSGRKYKKCCGK